MRGIDAAAILQATSHRPWPLPRAPWIMEQSWRRLLFAHWPVPPERLRALLPPGLEIDTYDGHAYVGIVPFSLAGLRIRALPRLPGTSDFLELNLRTYVRAGTRPGVFFIGMDASSKLAVLAARATFRLPYHDASMRAEEREGWIDYLSRRRDSGPASFVGRYRPVGEPFLAEPGSLDYFLTERYALYTVFGGRVWRGDIHHLPWQLRRAEAHIDENTLAARHGIDLPAMAPLVHYAERQDALIWAPVPANA